MLSVTFSYCCAECNYAECRYAECRGTHHSSLVLKVSSWFHLMSLSLLGQLYYVKLILYYERVLCLQKNV
jgi:hypothetical protein